MWNESWHPFVRARKVVCFHRECQRAYTGLLRDFRLLLHLMAHATDDQPA